VKNLPIETSVVPSAMQQPCAMYRKCSSCTAASMLAGATGAAASADAYEAVIAEVDAISSLSNLQLLLAPRQRSAGAAAGAGDQCSVRCSFVS
jgi:hypothetical protein